MLYMKFLKEVVKAALVIFMLVFRAFSAPLVIFMLVFRAFEGQLMSHLSDPIKKTKHT